MNSNVAISVDNLGKQYKLIKGSTQHDTLMDHLTERFKSLVQRTGYHSTRQDVFWALRNASFEIEFGENVGIIGLNGAGKSTLLKILSRITEPTTGRARITGRIGALLEVGTGFHPELTGRENVYLYGTILGMSKAEINRKFDSIVDFAGVDNFIDTPVKRYSSGMYVRLAFAVAAHLEPEILLLDEVLSVGDVSFQRKCIEFAKDLQKANATILFVSHNMFSIKTMCKRVIYLKHGKVIFDGPTDIGIKYYEEDCRLSTIPWKDGKPEEWPIFIKEFDILDHDGHSKMVFNYGECIRLRLRYQAHQSIQTPNFIIAIARSDGVMCCNYSTETDGFVIEKIAGEGVIELYTPPLKLVSELYTIHVLVREKGFQKLLCAQVGSTFHVRDDLFNTHFGVFHEPASWSWNDEYSSAVSSGPLKQGPKYQLA
jgi:lipopolysaccharide transport system ATP-binding protein